MISFSGTSFGKKKVEPFLGLDIGSNQIKLLEFDTTGEKPVLVNLCSIATPAGSFTNNAITKPELVSQAIKELIESNNVKAKKVAFSLPGPSAFIKRITVTAPTLEEIKENIQFEAANYIPHSIEAVHMDYQVLKVLSPTSFEVLLVAVKNEIITTYLQTIDFAELEPAIADVDYFAIENMFSINYPEETNRTVVVANIGARYTGVSILQDGNSLFFGDIGVGGRVYTDALCESLGLSAEDAEKVKLGMNLPGLDKNAVAEVFERTTEHVSAELHRQIGFFWNAAATDRSIDAIYLTGGGAEMSGLIEELATKTGLQCSKLDPFRSIETAEDFDREYLTEISLSMGVVVGLALRRFGDKPKVAI
jgi:type IV pilus assembly protein PilM